MGNFPLYLTIPIFFGIQILFAIAVGILESFTARFTDESIILTIYFGIIICFIIDFFWGIADFGKVLVNH